MKKILTIKKIVMALVVTFGIQTMACAQLGGLLDKAKNAAKEQAKNKATIKKHEAKATINDAVKSGELPSVNNSSSDEYSDESENATESETYSKASSRGGYEKKFDVDFSKAKHSDWDYTSSGATVEADFAYWLQRLAQSMASGQPDDIDWEALGRLNTGKPSFDFLDKTYHLYDEDKLTDYHAEQWQFELKHVMDRIRTIEDIGIPKSPNTDGLDANAKAKVLGQYMVTKANAYLERATKSTNPSVRTFQFYRAFGFLSTGVTMKWTNGSEDGFSEMASTMQTLYNELHADYKSDFPASYDIASLQAFDAQRKAAAKDKKPNEEVMKMKKGALLTQYRMTQKNGTTVQGFSGHTAWLEQAVKQNCPEWGNPVASRIHNDYKVETNSLGVPIYRTFTSEVICEDQGFRVCHEVFLKQDYSGGKYGETEIRPGGLKWNAKCSIVK